MTYRNFVHDAFHFAMHHCDHQTDGRYNQRHPQAQTGQIPDELTSRVMSLGITLLENALATNGVRNTQEVDNEADVLASATAAYQRGHITKVQYFAVIDALDETTTAETTTAWTVPNTAKIVRR